MHRDQPAAEVAARELADALGRAAGLEVGGQLASVDGEDVLATALGKALDDEPPAHGTASSPDEGRRLSRA